MKLSEMKIELGVTKIRLNCWYKMKYCIPEYIGTNYFIGKNYNCPDSCEDWHHTSSNWQYYKKEEENLVLSMSVQSILQDHWWKKTNGNYDYYKLLSYDICSKKFLFKTMSYHGWYTKAELAEDFEYKKISELK